MGPNNFKQRVSGAVCYRMFRDILELYLGYIRKGLKLVVMLKEIRYGIVISFQ